MTIQQMELRLDPNKSERLDPNKSERLDPYKGEGLGPNKSERVDPFENGRLDPSQNGRLYGSVAFANGDPSGPSGTIGTGCGSLGGSPLSNDLTSQKTSTL